MGHLDRNEDFDSGYHQLLIGQLQGRVRALENNYARIMDTLGNVSDDLKDINKTLNTTAGSRRTLVAVGTAGATIGGLIVAVLQLVLGS